MALSEFAIRKSRPKKKAYRIADGQSLHLLVQPSGAKSWQMRYRFLEKENVLTLGRYPAVSLAEARQKRDEAKKTLSEGIDPATKRNLDRIEAKNAARQTFGLIADEHIENLKAKGSAAATIAKATWFLRDLARPLSDRPIRDIHGAEILDLLKNIEKSGRRETARRLRGAIGSVFRLAVVTLRADSDPTPSLYGALLPPKVEGRAAITDEKEVGQLMQSIAGYDGWPTISAALQFLMLTCVRPGEVRKAVRSEFDLEKAVWHIPAERMKMRLPHDVPLSKQALAILAEVWSFSEGAELVFPSVRTKYRPLSENAFNVALRRMGYSKSEVTAHGFRVTASSILNSRGYDADVIEAALAHQDQNSIRRAYNRANYLEQRVILMQEWADLLDEFKERT